MKRILKWLLVFGAVIAVTSLLFSFYANFLLDYSLERLEMAMGATGKNLETISPVSRTIYRDVLRDLAVEEASKDKVDYKNLILLDLASNTVDEAQEDATYKRAHLYLKQVFASKLGARNAVLQFLDSLYFTVHRWWQQALSFGDYLFQRILTNRSREARTVEYSSVLLLNQAEEKLKNSELDEAAGLYQKYLEHYPLQTERGFVTLTLAEIYMKQKKIPQAQELLRNVESHFAGREEASVAASMLRKIDAMGKKSELVKQLQQQIPAQQQNMPPDETLQFKLAMTYFSSSQLEQAEAAFTRLQEAKNPEIKKKAKFYLALIYKVKSQYDKSATAILDLLNDPDIEKDMQMGLQAELADTYYQKGDVEKSLAQYDKLSKTADQKDIANKAMREVWGALSELEKAKIYHFDLEESGDSVNLGRQLAETGVQFSDFGKLAQEMKNTPELGVRERAFYALENGRVHFALDLFEKDLVRHSRDAWTQSGLATVYVLLGDLEKGLDLAKESHDFQPDYYTASVLGYIYSLLQQYDQAENYYREALGYKEDYMSARFNLASVYLKTDKFQEALGLLGRLDRDLGANQKLIRAKVFNNMGYAYWQLGDTEKARERFMQAMKAMPGFSIAKNNLSETAAGEAPKMANLRE